MVKNPPANAEVESSILGRGTEFPRAPGQLSPQANYTALCNPFASMLKRVLQARGRSRMSQLRPNTAKNNKIAK